MPMLEVLRSGAAPLSPTQKRRFAREAIRIFQEVIGTPPGRLRLFFIDLPAEETPDWYAEDAPVRDEQAGPPAPEEVESDAI